MDVLHILSPNFGLLINILSQILFFKSKSKPDPDFKLLRSIKFGLFLGLLSLVVIEVFIFLRKAQLHLDFWTTFNLNFITYLTLSYAYFHFINMSETARRIRILGELYCAKGGLSYEEIIKKYNAKLIIQKRLDRLLWHRQITNIAGKFYISNPTQLIMAKITFSIKRIIFRTRQPSIK